MSSQPYYVPPNNRADPETVSTIARGLGRDEVIRTAVGWSRFEYRGQTVKGIVLITNRAIYAAKDRMFGAPKIDIRVPLDSISEIGAGPLYGVGPTWSVQFRATGVGFFYVSDGQDAEHVVDILGRSLRALQDPDLDEFNRALDAAAASPPGSAGKNMTASDVSAESESIRRLVAAGRLQEAWDRRVALGYGVPSEGVPQSARFWIDADPAIAALKLGLKDHPLVATCCGVAQQNADLRDPEQAHAVETFNHLYHGTPPPSDVPQLPRGERDPGDTVKRLHATLQDAKAGDRQSDLYMNALSLQARGDDEAALGKFVEAAQLGSVDAMREAGVLSNSLGRKVDSHFWFQSAALAGDPMAMYNMGVACANSQDLDGARSWFQRAAEGGIANGYAALTSLAADANDSAAELKWSGLGASAGQLFCIARHGLLLAMTANGDMTQLRRARDYVEQAAERGDVPSAGLAVNLNADLHEPGRGRRFVDMVVATGDQDEMDRLRRYGYL